MATTEITVSSKRVATSAANCFEAAGDMKYQFRHNGYSCACKNDQLLTAAAPHNSLSHAVAALARRHSAAVVASPPRQRSMRLETFLFVREGPAWVVVHYYRYFGYVFQHLFLRSSWARRHNMFFY